MHWLDFSIGLEHGIHIFVRNTVEETGIARFFTGNSNTINEIGYINITYCWRRLGL